MDIPPRFRAALGLCECEWERRLGIGGRSERTVVLTLVGVFGLRWPGRFASNISRDVPSFVSYRDAVVLQGLQRVFQWAVCWTWSGLTVLQTHLSKSWKPKAPATRITAPSLGPPSRDGLA